MKTIKLNDQTYAIHNLGLRKYKDYENLVKSVPNAIMPTVRQLFLIKDQNKLPIINSDTILLVDGKIDLFAKQWGNGASESHIRRCLKLTQRSYWSVTVKPVERFVDTYVLTNENKSEQSSAHESCWANCILLVPVNVKSIKKYSYI